MEASSAASFSETVVVALAAVQGTGADGEVAVSAPGVEYSAPFGSVVGLFSGVRDWGEPSVD